ncbi:hypothetical protein BD779DRAFT_1678640 [Infundibulicybe gibba]|nr:hypothetical protein BD779DRAFT_1678640 [Infundibulicybe gibba]
MGALFQYIIDSPPNQASADPEIMRLVHHLLVALLTAPSKAKDKMGGPLDFALALLCYRGNQCFQDANFITRECAELQYCLRSIFVHAVRLGGIENPYTKPTPLQNDNNAEPNTQSTENDKRGCDAPAEDDDGNGLDNPSNSGHDSESSDSDEELVEDFRNTDDIGSDSGVEVLIPHGGEVAEAVTFVDEDKEGDNSEDGLNSVTKDAIISLLLANKRWISFEFEGSNPQTTAFQRLKSIWLLVHPFAIQTIGKTRINWQVGGQSLQFSDRGTLNPRQIHLQSFKSLAISLASGSRAALIALLPTTFDHKQLSIRLSEVFDDPGKTESVFKQNPRLFTQIGKGLYENLISPSETDHKQPTPVLMSGCSDVEGLGRPVAQVDDIENAEGTPDPDVDYSDMPPLEDLESSDDPSDSVLLGLRYV